MRKRIRISGFRAGTVAMALSVMGSMAPVLGVNAEETVSDDNPIAAPMFLPEDPDPADPYIKETESGKQYIDERGYVVKKSWVLFEDKDYYADEEGFLVSGKFLALANGYTYYFDADGVLQYGLFTTDGGKFYADARGRVRKTAGWISIGGKWYYTNSDGSIRCDQVIWGSGTAYYAGEDGALCGGVHLANGKLRFFNADGSLRKTAGWVKYSGIWYYTDANGFVATNTVLPDGDYFYYVGEDGKLTDKVLTVEGKLRYFDKKGKMKTGTGWVEYDGNWYFAGEGGILSTNVVVRDAAKKYYYLGEDGKLSGGIVEWNDKTWYFDADGLLASVAKWVKEDGSWYYVNQNGEIVKDSAVTSDGATYYLGSDGKLTGGFQKVDGKLQFFNPNGKLRDTEGWMKYQGSWYYIDADAVVATDGKMTIKGKTYMFSDSGKMLTGKVNAGNGNFYYLTDSGVLVIDQDFTLEGIKYHADKDGLVMAGAMYKKAQNYSSPTDYMILVNLKTQKTGVFKGSKGNWVMVKEYISCTGKASSPTPTGEYNTTVHSKSFVSHGVKCWYATGFIGGLYLFHSVPYVIDDAPNVIQDNTLGKPNSAGCVRLKIEDAKWIYDNLPLRTKVVIYNESE